MLARRLTQALHSCDGAEIAEAAVVLPVAFLILLGIIWFGRAFNVYSTIQQAAQQGAIAAARNSCASATCGDSPEPDGSVTPCPETAPATTVAGTVATVMCASSIDPTLIPVSSSPPSPASCSTSAVTCTSPGNISVCRQVLLNSPASTQPPQCGSLVSFQYPFSFGLPGTSIISWSITLSAQAQSRQER